MYPLFDIISMMLYDVCEFKRKTGKPIRNGPINSSAILTFKQKQMFQWRQTVWCGRVKPPPNLESSLNLKPSMISHSLFLLWNIYIYINIIYDHYHYTGCLCHVYKVSDEAAELEESAGDPRSAKLLRCISQTHKATYHKDANIHCFKTYHQHI